MVDRIEVGKKLCAKHSDGWFYFAEVLEVSTEPWEAPVKVRWTGKNGFGVQGEEWLPVHSLKFSEAHDKIKVTDYSKIQAAPLKGREKLAESYVSQLAFGPHGKLWVLDRDLARVVEFNLSGSGERILGKGQLEYPHGIAVACLGNEPELRFFVSDHCSDRHVIKEMQQSDGHVVRELSTSPAKSTGKLERNAHGDLNCPMGLSLNPSESILAVADMKNYRILLIPLDGSLCVNIGLDGQPSDVAFTMDGQQLVAATPYSQAADVVGIDGSLLRRISWEVCGCPKGADENFAAWLERDVAELHQKRPGEVRAVAVDGSGCIVSADERGLKVHSLEGALLHDQVGNLPAEFRGRRAGLAVDLTSGRIAAASDSSSQGVAPVFVFQMEDMAAVDATTEIHGRGKGKSKGKGKPMTKGKGKGK